MTLVGVWLGAGVVRLGAPVCEVLFNTGPERDNFQQQFFSSGHWKTIATGSCHDKKHTF